MQNHPRATGQAATAAAAAEPMSTIQ
jgi:hypothetical protein